MKTETMNKIIFVILVIMCVAVAIELANIHGYNDGFADGFRLALSVKPLPVIYSIGS